MKGLVVDASVALTWCYPDEHSPYAAAVLDALVEAPAAVPALWATEVANALLVGERRKRLTQAEIVRFLDLLSAIAVTLDPHSAGRAFTHILPLARMYGLSAYDATYLDLAMREKLPLATLDEQLRVAAKSAGIELFTA